MAKRPTLDVYLMALATQAALRTTCIRRGVGCVLANTRGHVLAIGYNGVASGLPHCNEATSHEVNPDLCVVPEDDSPGYFRRPEHWELEVIPMHANACAGHDLPPGQDSCEAVHAEQNALLQCRDPWTIDTAYVTLSPCKACLKLLLGTSCRRIVFLEEHVDPMPRELWTKAGRGWEQLPVQWPMVVP